MFYYEGHSVQELEQILNISAGTLYGTLARARCYLRAALVNYTSTNRSSKTNPHRTKVLKPITAENNRASISNTSHQIVAP
jgi:transposase